MIFFPKLFTKGKGSNFLVSEDVGGMNISYDLRKSITNLE